MSVILILFIILMFLMIFVGDSKGMRSFAVLLVDFALLYFLFTKIVNTHIPILLTFIMSAVLCALTLLILNGFKKKTVIAFICVMAVITLMLALLFIFSYALHIQGFDKSEFDSIGYLSTNVNISFVKVLICEMIIAIISAVTDTAMTISSSINELHETNPGFDEKKLFTLGMNVGRDILGTTVNTMFFVYFINLIVILIWYGMGDLSAGIILNSKLLSQVIFQIALSGITVILVIPVTAKVTARVLSSNK